MNVTRKDPPWLLADVGGTNVRFALGAPGSLEPLRLESVFAYRVADFASLADAVRAYLEVVAIEPRHAVFAIAGSVRGEVARLTNRDWVISTVDLCADLGLESAMLVNDFAAVGMSLPLLRPDDVVGLSANASDRTQRLRRQTFCVLGPGTGLGVAGLALVDGVVVGLDSEGGHISFAPTTEEEIDLLRVLTRRFGRVSLERLVCGTGIRNMYEAVCAIDGVPPGGYAPEEITAHANSQSDPQCVRTVQMFCDVLAATAGDFVLAYGAWDGAYLSGGVLAGVTDWLHQPRFVDRFCAKGRFEPALREVPLGLIVHPQPGLLGAAAYAVIGSGRTLPGESISRS